MIFAIIIVIVINIIRDNTTLPMKKTNSAPMKKTNSAFVSFIIPNHIRNVADKYITLFIRIGKRYETRLRW